MRKAFYSLLLFFLALPGWAQPIGRLKTLELLAKSDPDSVVSLMAHGGMSGLTVAESNYINCLAYMQKGQYILVDSLIRVTMEGQPFTEDSVLYPKFLCLLAEQRKVTDNFESSLTSLYEAIEFYRQRRDTLELANAYINMAELYRAAINIPLGLEYLDDAEQLVKNLTEDASIKVMARLYNRRAALLVHGQTYYDTVERLSLLSMNLARKAGDKDLEAASNNELGQMLRESEPRRAERYLLNAVRLWDDIGYDSYAAHARLNLSHLYLNNGRNREGIETLRESLPLVSKGAWQEQSGRYYQLLGEHFGALGMFDSAYHYQRKGNDIVARHVLESYTQQLVLLSSRMELDKRQLDIQRRQDEMKLMRLEQLSQEAENRRLYFFLILMAIIAIAFFLFSMYISRQKNLLRTQQKVISSTNERLTEVLVQKEALIREMNHRVKNNLTVLSGLLYLQGKKLKNEEARKALTDSQMRISSIAMVHESLYDRGDRESVNFQEYLVSLVTSIKNIFWSDSKPINIRIECQGLVLPLRKSVPLAMIFNELVTNSFKYAFDEVEEANIFIGWQEGSITYYDNGPGYECNSETDSLGLYLIRLFLLELKASVTSEYEDGKLTSTIFLDNSKR